MTDAGRHPNITLLTLSEVKSITGFVGNFHVRVLKRARYVKEKECTACGECKSVCPVVVPDEFNMGLNTRRAIYSPFPQAVPSAYMVDIEQCLGHNPIICGKCIEKCEKRCIDFSMNDEELTFDVGTIIVATETDVHDPAALDEYGYTRYENVLTSMEFERLINAGGPTNGEVIRLTDGKRPESVAFIQCVGSRSIKRGHPYCSSICCMNTVKSAIMLKEHYPDIEVKVFYIDIRAFGKGFEELFRRSKGMGIRYIRGLPGSVREDPAGRDLVLSVENTATNDLDTHRAQMVILSVGLEPPADMKHIQEMLSLQKTSDGFSPSKPTRNFSPSIPLPGGFFCRLRGRTQGHKGFGHPGFGRGGQGDAPDESGDAQRGGDHGGGRSFPVQSLRTVRQGMPLQCHHRGARGKAAGEDYGGGLCGMRKLRRGMSGRAIQMNHFTDGQIEAQIDAILEEDAAERVLVFACNWCSYAGADFAGVSRLPYSAKNRLIRTMCSARVREDFVWRAFEKGAPVVLVSGCHFGDCHYISANHWTERRVKKIWKRMEKLGIRTERLGLEWISAAEGLRFQQVMADMERIRATVTPEEIERTQELMKKQGSRKKGSAPAEVQGPEAEGPAT